MTQFRAKWQLFDSWICSILTYSSLSELYYISVLSC